MKDSDCPVFVHPQGKETMLAISEGKMSTYNASELLSIPEMDIWKCFESHVHWKTEDEEQKPEEPQEMEDPTVTLRNIINMLSQKVTEVLESAPQDKPTAWLKELRMAIMNLAELEGKLQKAPLVQLTQMKVQFDQLTSLLMNELCPDCREKVISKLEEIIEPA